jgi:xylan 1,4-beta-xylosidase
VTTSADFIGDLRGPSTAFPHFWEHTVGSGHATLGLRADWQTQLKRVHAELGMRHVRFQGLLSDDMGTLICQDDALLYSFFNADRIFDFLLSIGMKPFVELSFMPTTLASGSQTVFHYRANVTAPKDLAQWSVLIRKLTSHWVARYGLDEVRQWYFEVWNEPNLTAFGSGKQSDYFELYRYTVQAIKGVDNDLRVGGPATAANAWIPKRRWEQMGEPEYLSDAMLQELQSESLLRREHQPMSRRRGGEIRGRHAGTISGSD